MAMTSPLFSLMGIRVIESALMVNQVHVGTWLNGYRATPNRSQRLTKKLLRGTRNRRPIIEAMIEAVPKREMYQLPTGEMVGHPATIAEVMLQMDVVGSMLGMRRP